MLGPTLPPLTHAQPFPPQTSSSYTALNVTCQDRKGLIYDIFRSLKDIDVRTAFGKIEVVGSSSGGGSGGTCTLNIFVQDAEGGRVSDR